MDIHSLVTLVLTPGACAVCLILGGQVDGENLGLHSYKSPYIRLNPHVWSQQAPGGGREHSNLKMPIVKCIKLKSL